MSFPPTPRGGTPPERIGFLKLYCPVCKDRPGWGEHRKIVGPKYYDQVCNDPAHEPGVPIVARRVWDKRVMNTP